MQYLRARHYDPSIGSFTTQDAFMGTSENPITQNRYAYGNNNPVMTVDPSGNFGLFFWAAVAVVAVAVYVFRPSPPAPAPAPYVPYTPTYTPAPAPVSSAPATSSGGGYNYSGTSSWSGGGGSSGGGTVSYGGGGGGSYGGGGGSSGGGYVYVDPTIAMRSEYKTSLFGNFFSNVASSFTNRLKENTDRILSSIKTTADGILNTVTKPGQWFKNKYIDPVVDTVKDISDNGWKNSALGKTVTNSINSVNKKASNTWDTVKESSLFKTVAKVGNNVSNWYQDNKTVVNLVAGTALIVGLGIATVATGGAATPLLGAAVKGAFIGAATGGLIGGTTGGVASAISGGSFIEGFADGYAVGAFSGAASGAVGAAPLGKVGKVAGDALVETATYVAETKLSGGEINAGELAFSAFGGLEFEALPKVNKLDNLAASASGSSATSATVAKKVHRNSKESMDANHMYVIYKKEGFLKSVPVKVGISGEPLNGKLSNRAENQIKNWVKDGDTNQYKVKIVKKNIQGRTIALELEKAKAFDLQKKYTGRIDFFSKHKKPCFEPGAVGVIELNEKPLKQRVFRLSKAVFTSNSYIKNN